MMKFYFHWNKPLKSKLVAVTYLYFNPITTKATTLDSSKFHLLLLLFWVELKLSNRGERVNIIHFNVMYTWLKLTSHGFTPVFLLAASFTISVLQSFDKVSINWRGTNIGSVMSFLYHWRGTNIGSLMSFYIIEEEQI